MDNRRHDSYEVIIFYRDFSSRIVATYRHRRNAVWYAESICNREADAVGYRVQNYRAEEGM